MCKMGELIKKVGTLSIADCLFDIEINASADGTGMREIHIQNDTMRVALPEDQFCKMAACVLLARKQLHQIKEKD